MMKRNILAVVIPAVLVAGAANAAEIYNKNGNEAAHEKRESVSR